MPRVAAVACSVMAFCFGVWATSWLCSTTSKGRSRDVGRIHVVLGLLGLMTFEALFGGIRDHRFCWITSRPGLEAPASGRGILLLVLQHDGGRLPWTFHVGAIGDGEFVQIDQEHAPVPIAFALL